MGLANYWVETWPSWPNDIMGLNQHAARIAHAESAGSIVWAAIVWARRADIN